MFRYFIVKKKKIIKYKVRYDGINVIRSLIENLSCSIINMHHQLLPFHKQTSCQKSLTVAICCIGRTGKGTKKPLKKNSRACNTNQFMAA